MVMFCAEKYLLGSESKLRLMVGERESERREGDSDKSEREEQWRHCSENTWRYI